MKRRRFLGCVAAAGVAAAGCDLAPEEGFRNACRDPRALPASQHPLVAAAWNGLDSSRVIDSHCHVFGNGANGSGLWFNPRMDDAMHPVLALQRRAFLNAACVPPGSADVDAAVIERLRAQCEAMREGFGVLLLAFDWARDARGAPDRERSTFHVPDDYVRDLALRFPARFAWAASIHPYDPAALDRLDAAAAQGALAVKWLPTAQGIDPADARCDAFYRKLAALRLPLVTHAGDERAVTGFGEHLGNPLRLRRPLDAGVRVVAAHCASLGRGRDLDTPGAPMVGNFDLFARLMDDPRYGRSLLGDLAAVVQANRNDTVARLLSRPDWHDRLVNGSDYPLPGVPSLVSLRALVDRGLLDAGAVAPLRELRDHNVLSFDFVLKRSLALEGRRFPAKVFETRRHFPPVRGTSVGSAVDPAKRAQ
jgi:mannonate dehydratase